MKTDAQKKVIVFLALTFALCLPLYGAILSAGSLGTGGGIYVVGLMWCPGIAGLLTRLVFQRNLRGIGWGWGGSRYQALSYLLPVLAGLVVYGIVWSTGLGGFTGERLTAGVARGFGLESASLPLALLLAATVGFLTSVLFATGEELGWRGLLVPELAKRFGFTGTALISAAVWAIYHYPVILFADYRSTAPVGYSLAMFTVLVTAVSFILAWLRLRSGSVWTGVIFHASHNLFIQSVFDPLTDAGEATPYITTEFGVGLALVYSAVAFWCWRQRASLPNGVAAEVPATPA